MDHRLLYATVIVLAALALPQATLQNSGTEDALGMQGLAMTHDPLATPTKSHNVSLDSSSVDSGIVLAISFQHSGSSKNSVMQWIPELPRLTDVTIQFWFRLKHSSSNVTIFVDYANEDDELCLYYDATKRELVVQTQPYTLTAETDLPFFTWSHLSVSLGLVSGNHHIRVNGQKIVSKSSMSSKADEGLPSSGSHVLTLARKQRSLDLESLDIADFCIFPDLQMELGEILSCRDNNEIGRRPTVTTDRFSQWIVSGNIKIYSLPKVPLYRVLENSNDVSARDLLSEANCPLFDLPPTYRKGNGGTNLPGKETDFKYFPSHGIIRIYGLCKTSRFERELSIRNTQTQMPVFLGSNTQISWENTTWVMTSLLSPQLQAAMIVNATDTNPVGLHEWHITGDDCPNQQEELLLTVCGEDSFPCNDGTTCVDMNHRCDLRAHCEDGSDERNCEKVITGAKYDKTLPPPPTNGESVINVTLSVIIFAVHDLDLLAQTVRLNILLTSHWEDSRVKYIDLEWEQFRNEIQKPERLWQPLMIFTDDTGSRVNLVNVASSLRVLRKTEPLPSDNTRTVKAVVFPGAGNQLMLEQELSISFQCQFSLRWFPFDNQRCSVNLRFSDMESRLLRLMGSQPNYVGQKKLHEYRVQSIDMGPGKGENEQRITIWLTNLFIYYLSNSYLPSFLLVIISYSTFYFPLEGFNERIMANITAMLVLVALFQQPCSTILKTTYLKLIDVWYMVCIIVDFIMVIVLVTIEYIRSHVDDTVKVFPASAGVKPLFSEENTAKKYNTIARAVLPFMFLLFFGVYGIISAIHYWTG